MDSIKVNKIQIILIFFILCITIILKSIMYDLLPAKYFYDANHILNSMNNFVIEDKAYTFTANFFNYINVLNLKTLQEWAYFITLIFILFVINIVYKNKKYTLFQIFFILATVVLLNIYVFGLSKDIIQCIFFTGIYFVLNSKLKNFNKLILICLILLIEALSFRIYYGIMALILVTIYFGVKFIGKKRKNIVMFTIVMFFIEVFFVSLLSPHNYESILLARSSVNIYREDSLDAITIINDLLGTNKNFLLFMGNYIINFFRLLFPIELFFKGIKYTPFIIYQLYITYNFFKALKKLNKENILWISTMLSYFMISTIFEPDFGSFIRHESAIFLVMQYLIFSINKDKEKIR